MFVAESVTDSTVGGRLGLIGSTAIACTLTGLICERCTNRDE